MTSETGGRRPRRSDDGLIDTVEELAVGVGRLGYGLLSLGIDLLPPQSRRHMHNAVRELSHAFATLPGDFATIAGAEIERWAAADGDVAHAHHAEARVQHITISTDGPLGSAAAATAATASAVGIAHIEYDPPGRDVDGEYVLIRNAGPDPANMTGWALRDGGARHSFVFPAFTLAPGAEVRLWTRAGVNDASNLYWGSTGAIWNNTGDSATLSDAAGNLVGSYAYEGRKL